MSETDAPSLTEADRMIRAAVKRAGYRVRWCSFCGKRRREVRRMMETGPTPPPPALPNVVICDECVSLCVYAMSRDDSIVAAELFDALRSDPTTRGRRSQ